MNNLKENKAVYVILSILIATVLWFYVVTQVNTDTTDTIKNVPVAVTGLDVLESRNLMITEQNINELDIKVAGNRNSLVKLLKDNINVTADVSSITQAGEYELRCTVSLPTTIMAGSATVNERDSYRVIFTVEEKIKKTVPIEGNFTGSVAEGYQADNFILSPSSIEITGPASIIDPIEFARVTLTATNLNETYSGILPFELVNEDGTLTDLERVECAAPTVYVVYPIVMVRELELKATFLPGGGATEENVTYEIGPTNTIHVSGDEKDVANLTELPLGPIDLSKVGATGTFTYPIFLPAGVTNESGITEVTVTVKVSGLTMKTLETDRIELINTPEGFQAEKVTQSLKITVRGSREAVESVTAQNLQVVADLSEVGESEGQFRVPVKVYLNSTGDVGVFGADYTISVNLWK